MKKLPVYFILIVLLIFSVFFVYKTFYFVHNSKAVILVIPRGATASSISYMLKKSDIIISTRIFLYQVRQLGAAREMKAGKYLVLSKMKITDLINKFLMGLTIPPPRITVSIPEGYTINQTISKLNEKMRLVNAKEFRRICTDRKFINSLGLNVKSLEGFLFPDTYKFFENTTETNVITTMFDNFKRQTRDLYAKAGNFRTFYRILKIASIVEKETRVDTERRIIAAVYFNRLRERIHLDADPTIRYALNKDTGFLSFKDLKIKSPYNTYSHYGLPPTPISNPGMKSIDAAANPANVGYIYFVSNADGGHFFSDSFRQHLRNKRKYKHNLWKRRLNLKKSKF